MDVQDYDYELPLELIAQNPSAERTQSRLMVLSRTTAEVKHAHFFDIPDLLKPGDLLIANDSRVIPARLFGVKTGTGAVVELLLLHPLAESGTWEALVRPGRRIQVGHTLSFGDGQLMAEVIGIGEDGTRMVRFSAAGEVFDALLERLGDMPLPPYIKERLTDKERYQTVYARHKGSVAAPTAGLHFTDELLTRIREAGIEVAFITLHVGLGTFRPVQAARIEDHHMHEEWYEVTAPVWRAVLQAKASGRRIVCVGTTTVRALESAWRQWAPLAHSAGPDTEDLQSLSGATDIFIYPGVPLHVTDALITNFHLPQSTLLMLVSTLVGREKLMRAYQVAIAERYRFYSFGDAMLVD